MGKITATVLTTLFIIGVSGGAMAQGMAPSSPGSSSSSPADSLGSNSATQAKIATTTQVKSKLEESGYTSVSGIQKSTDGWTATATKDGKSVRVAIDQRGNIETR